MPTTFEISHATYLRKPLQAKQLKFLANEISELISEKFPDIDYIAGCGISGISVISAVSCISGKDMFIVRKEEDRYNHSFFGIDVSNLRTVEFFPKENDKNLTALIIDDLISTGKTINRIYMSLKNHNILSVGIFLFAPSRHYEVPEYHNIDRLEIPIFYSNRDYAGSWM